MVRHCIAASGKLLFYLLPLTLVGGEAKEALLFEKRSKNFGLLMRALMQPKYLIVKGFLVLFCKKERLPLLRAIAPRAA
jgi:hypothetical protein